MDPIILKQLQYYSVAMMLATEPLIPFMLYLHAKSYWKSLLLVRFGVGIPLAVFFYVKLSLDIYLNFSFLLQMILYWPAFIISAIMRPFTCVDLDPHALYRPVICDPIKIYYSINK